ncbi:hypothetical protein BDW02DRAFT_565254 [Decorospora gaudefroyi]|uniref:Heterokaryon incompatibility domain-containing protein n=1 Tax=Decorospora gaudefroyi TaxID=184978 RepID=A0A6A5KQA0_9PLEO|nr:hypothetical protein BDW02DRAFT_565254 [Decorospora gaudefroyi]
MIVWMRRCRISRLRARRDTCGSIKSASTSPAPWSGTTRSELWAISTRKAKWYWRGWALVYRCPGACWNLFMRLDLCIKTETPLQIGWDELAELLTHDSQLLDGISLLLQNKWFSRAWVFQDIALSKHATFLIGNITVPFLMLQWITSMVPPPLLAPPAPLHDPRSKGHISLPVQSSRVLSTMHNLWWTMSHKHPVGGSQFIWLLSRISHISETSDPRDAVYAFLGLQLEPSITIEPSYTSSREDVLIDTAISIIRGSGSLDTLAYCDRLRNPEPTGHLLPSWVPDWKAPLARPPLRMYRLPSPVQSFWKHSWLATTNKCELRVKGIRIDTISKLFEPAFRYQTDIGEQDLEEYINLDGRLKDIEEHISCTRERLLRVIIAPHYLRGVDAVYRGHEPSRVELSPIEAYLDTYDQYINARQDDSEFSENSTFGDMRYYTSHAENRHIFLSERGFLGLVSRTCEGSIICLITGLNGLVVLRPSGANRFSVVECVLGNRACTKSMTTYAKILLWTSRRGRYKTKRLRNLY